MLVDFVNYPINKRRCSRASVLGAYRPICASKSNDGGIGNGAVVVVIVAVAVTEFSAVNGDDDDDDSAALVDILSERIKL